MRAENHARVVLEEAADAGEAYAAAWCFATFTSALSGLPASRLVLEITETVLMDELRAIDHLEQLRTTGVRIGIDHFGTGYNSLARLQHLPIDIIKIDKGFLDPQNPSALQLLDVLIRAAHIFHIPVIAEGVESRAQLEHLEELRCDAAQGYYLGRPMTPSDGDALLAERTNY